jgi:8-oxo-dGTP pyrophosphatase MutT (NUDIX family)
MSTIRALAIGVFITRDRILVTEAHDPVNGQTFCRPLGGGIHFGETGAQALQREIREEIGAEIGNLRFLGTLENIFTYLGAPGHEIVQVFDADFADKSLYAQDRIAGGESDGKPFEAVWRELSCFSARYPVYPNGLLELLRARFDVRTL